MVIKIFNWSMYVGRSYIRTDKPQLNRGVDYLEMFIGSYMLVIEKV